MPFMPVSSCRAVLRLGCVLGALHLAACAAMVPPPSSTPVAEPTAVRVETVHRVLFDLGADQPNVAELECLDVFLASLSQDSAPEFRVVGRAGSSNADTSTPDLPTRRTDAVARLIRERSGPGASVSTATLRDEAQFGAAPVEQVDALGRSVEIVATTYSVRLPECPDWTRSPAFDPRNLPSSNLGCANAVNLGLMIADPADLAQGHPLGPADGIREAEAVVRYRTDKVNELKAGMTDE
jgi:type IV pilus biogenesis protein CpaD/CtpE